MKGAKIRQKTKHPTLVWGKQTVFLQKLIWGVTHITSVNKAVPLMNNKMHTSTCKKKFARNMSNVPNSG